MQTNRFERIHSFLNETIEYFLLRSEGVDRDRYFADRDKRNILDKSINDIILAVVDLSEECLKKRGREVIGGIFADAAKFTLTAGMIAGILAGGMSLPTGILLLVVFAPFYCSCIFHYA